MDDRTAVISSQGYAGLPTWLAMMADMLAMTNMGQKTLCGRDRK